MRVCQATHPIFSYRWLTRYQICRQNFHLCFIVYEWAIKRCRNPVHWCIFAKDSETGKGLILKVSIISSSGWGTHQFRIMIFKGHIIRLRTRKCNPFGNWFWGYAELRLPPSEPHLWALADGKFKNKARIQLRDWELMYRFRESWDWVRTSLSINTLKTSSIKSQFK